ncbi:MAG: alpha/beta hydrolase [Deltaproteobacteria bacterium]|nr:alpha/beta hydrolase [Deltaproteobacteria bacterium]
MFFLGNPDPYCLVVSGPASCGLTPLAGHQALTGKGDNEHGQSNRQWDSARQLVATIGNGNRKPRLASITAPTLVIHGAQDPLIPLEGGKDTAKSIPGADLLIIEGMGHSLPRAAWPQIVEAIIAHTRRASGWEI